MVSPVVKAAAKAAGMKPPTTPREKAARRLENDNETGKADRIIGQLRTLSRTELHKIAAAVGDLLDERN